MTRALTTRGLSWALAAMTTISACGDDRTVIPYSVEVVAADGSALNLDGHTVRIEVKEGDADTLSAETTGGIDFSFPISSASEDARVRIFIEGDEPLIGAPPVFSPASSGGFLRIAVAPPATCQTVPVDRPSASAFARVGTFIIGVGGPDSGGSGGRRVEAFDLLRFAVATLTPIGLNGTGPVALTSVGRSRFIALSDDGAALYDAADSETPSSPLTLHEGASAQSSVLRLASGSALVVGPAPAEAGPFRLSLVAPDGTVATGELAADVQLGELFVVESGPSAFVVAKNTRGDLSIWRVDVARVEGELVSDALAVDFDVTGAAPLSNGAWLVGSDGRTSLLRCNDTCQIEAGPQLPTNVAEVSANGGGQGNDGAYVLGELVISLARNVEGATDPNAFEVIAAADATISSSALVTPFDGGTVLLLDDTHLEYCVPSELSAL